MTTNNHLRPRFSLGRLVATPGALQALEEAGQSPTDFLSRHVAGDWGEVCAGDKKLNDEALVNGERLLSAYRTLRNVRIWVITEADRASTCVCLPEDTEHGIPTFPTFPTSPARPGHPPRPEMALVLRIFERRLPRKCLHSFQRNDGCVQVCSSISTLLVRFLFGGTLLLGFVPLGKSVHPSGRLPIIVISGEAAVNWGAASGKDRCRLSRGMARILRLNYPLLLNMGGAAIRPAPPAVAGLPVVALIQEDRSHLPEALKSPSRWQARRARQENRKAWIPAGATLVETWAVLFREFRIGDDQAYPLRVVQSAPFSQGRLRLFSLRCPCLRGMLGAVRRRLHYVLANRRPELGRRRSDRHWSACSLLRRWRSSKRKMSGYWLNPATGSVVFGGGFQADGNWQPLLRRRLLAEVRLRHRGSHRRWPLGSTPRWLRWSPCRWTGLWDCPAS